MELIGKNKLKSYFDSLIKNRTLGQFYILEGPEGAGKNTFVNYVAAAAHCEAQNPPCGVCGSCIKHKTHNHPDFIRIKNEDASLKTLSVDTVRHFSEDMYTKPFLSDTKIYVLDDSLPITAEAQNAFLKILEEPPSYAVIFLLVKNSAELLQTVLSRGMLCRVDQCSKSETVGYVKKYYPDAAPRAELIAEFSGGILGSAKAMAEGGEYFELRRAFYETLSKTAAANPAGLFEICDFVHKNKEKLNLILNFLLSWLRDAVCVKLTGEEKIINFDYRESICAFSASFTAEQLLRAAEETEKTALSFAPGNNLDLWMLNLVKSLQ